MTTIKIHDGVDDWGWPYFIGYYPLDASTIIKKIEAANGDDITVRISSGGGNVWDGWMIYNAILLYKEQHGAHVAIIIDGIAASIASVIAMSGDHIIMMRGSLLMVHKPTVGICDSMDADGLQKEADVLNLIQDVCVDIYADKSKLDTETIHSMVNEETWLKPDQALALGFCDEISQQGAVKVLQNSMTPYMDRMPANMRTYCNNLLIKNSKMATKKRTNNTANSLIRENKGLVSRAKEAIKNFLSSATPQNTEAELADGGSIYFDGELEVGTLVYSDEDMTEALGDGEYDLADDRILTVADGAVTAIEEADDTDPENQDDDEDPENSEESKPQNKSRLRELQNQINRLKKENADLRNQIEASNEVLTSLENIKSKGKPSNRQTNFGKGKQGKADNFREEMKNRRSSYKK